MGGANLEYVEQFEVGGANLEWVEQTWSGRSRCGQNSVESS